MFTVFPAILLMKPSLPPILAAALLALPLATFAQELPIRATTKLHPDGSKTVVIVSPEKRTADETVSDASGKVVSKKQFVLDESGTALGAIYQDLKGNVRYKVKYTRDASGRVIQNTLLGKDGAYLGKRIFHYNTRGDVTQVDDYNANDVLIRPAVPAKPGKARR